MIFTSLGIRLASGRILRPCVFNGESALFRLCVVGTSTAEQVKSVGTVSCIKQTKILQQYDHIPGLCENLQLVRTIGSRSLLQSKVMPNAKREEPQSLNSETDSSPKQEAADGTTAEVQEPLPQPLSRKAQLKQAIKDYGATVIIFHVTMSLGSLGFFYMLVSSGLDVLALLESFGVSKSVLESKVTQGASTFVVAYAVHKVFAPVRITITLTAVPFLVKYLRRIGFLKAVKQ